MMPEIVEDTGIYPVMVTLGAALVLELAASHLDPAVVRLRTGPPFALPFPESDECRSLVVSYLESFPTDNFPSPALNENTCQTRLAYRLSVSIVLCAEVEPSAEDDLASTRESLAYMAALRRGICKGLGTANRDFRFVRNVASLGAEGDLGGTWEIVVDSIGDS